MSDYQPWRYAPRDEYQEWRKRTFRNNAEVTSAAAQAAPRQPSAADEFDEVTAPKKGKSTLGKIGSAAKAVGKAFISGEELQKRVGIDTSYLDRLEKRGLAGKIAATAIDELTSPVNLTAVFAGPAIGAGIRAATAGTKLSKGGRLIANIAEPALSGPVARRWVAETGAGVGARLASEQAAERLPEGTPGPLRVGASLAAGLAGGAVGLNAGRVVKAGASRAHDAALGLDAAINEPVPSGRVAGMAAPEPRAKFLDVRPAGREITVQSTVDPNSSYQFRYRVVDLSEPAVSHDPYTFAENPAFNQKLQPRDRSLPASQEQVRTQASALDPNKLLAETGDLQNGVPIIGPDGLVESGNGRMMAALRAAKDHPKRWEAYQQELRRRLPEYGLDEQALEGIERPVLVRERISDVANREAFVEEANGATVLLRGATERAAAEARVISDELLANLDVPEGASLDDVLQSPRNAGFVRKFIEQVPVNERGPLLDAKGQLSADGVKRLKAAIFRKTYPGEAGERLLGSFFESADPDVKNIRNALENSLGAVASVEAAARAGRLSPELSIADAVAQAADTFRLLKSGTTRFKTVSDYLNQVSFIDELELSPLARDILRFMDENSRSAKPLREALRGYADIAANLPPPGQSGMFADAVPANAVDVWQRATGRVLPDETARQEAMFRSRPVFGGGVEEVVAAEAQARSSRVKLYHGTPERSIQSPADLRPDTGNGEGLLGVWMTENPKRAELFASNFGETVGTVHATEIDTAGFLDLTDAAQRAAFVQKHPEIFEQRPYGNLATVEEYLASGYLAGVDRDVANKIIRAAADDGYPGVKIPDIDESVAAKARPLSAEKGPDAFSPAYVVIDQGRLSDAAAPPVSPSASTDPASTRVLNTPSPSSPDDSVIRNTSSSEAPSSSDAARSASGSVVGETSPGSGTGTAIEGSVPPRQRPEGEPKVVAIPGGTSRSVDELRAAAPPGYRLHVPDDGEPVYRRVLTQADMDWIAEHPVRPAVSRETARGMFPTDRDAVDLADDIATQFALYHPKWNSPTDDLRASFDNIKNAARSALNKVFKRDLMESMGMDSAADLKMMDPADRRAFYKTINDQTRAALKEIETDVTRDEWWDGLVDSKGQGFREGRPTGGIGGRVEEPTGLPPWQPPREPPIQMGNRGTQPLGSDAEPVDLLGTRPKSVVRAEAVERGSRLPAQIKNRLKAALGRLESEDVRRGVDPVLREKNRIDNVIAHQVAWAVARERAVMRAAGLEVVKAADGSYRLTANGRDVGLFEDVIERVSDTGRAAFKSLTPEQKNALRAVGETNNLFNKTIEFHGRKVRIDPEIEGDYFGRRAIAREYIGADGKVVRREKDSTLPSRRIGANRTKSRVMQSLEEGFEKGIRYDNPWEARAAILRGKLLDAEDGYLKKSLKNLQVKDRSTVGLGRVDQPAFSGMWFEPDVARRIDEGLKTKPPLATLQAINNVMTPLRASFDLSATWQQGMRAWLTNPKMASEYWWEVARSLKDESIYEGMLLRLDGEGPGLHYLLERGLRFTGEGAEGEFLFPKAFLDKVGKAGLPGKGINKAFTKSNEHFGRLLNSYRIKFANDQYERLAASGLSGKELDDAMRQSVDGINRMFGWTHAKTSTVENALIFAPRYTRASIETLLAAVTNGGIEGQMARKHLGLLLAEGAAVVWLLNEIRGHETNFDPRDQNFLRVRDVGGLDVSPFGTYNTLFRALAQTVAGDVHGDGLPNPAAAGRFIEGKLSPAASMLYWPLKGETYLGEPLSPTAGPGGFAKTVLEQGKSSLPFGVQNLIGEGPGAAVIGSTGLSSTPVTPAERRDFLRGGSPGGVSLPGVGNIQTTGRRQTGLAQEMFGQDYEDLPGAQKAVVNENPEIQRQQEKVDERAMRQGGDRGMSAQIRQQVQAELAASAQYLAEGRGQDGKLFTGNDFRKAYNDTMLRAAGARQLIKAVEGDKVVDGWFKLYEQATMPNGQLDYETLERMQAEYSARHPDVEEKVAQQTGIRDNAAVRELREAKKLAREYYSIPAYRGMTVQEAEKAGQFLALANDLVATGQARNRRHALVLLRGFDEEGARLALKANRLGPNRERAKFRQSNPLFARYYFAELPQAA